MLFPPADWATYALAMTTVGTGMMICWAIALKVVDRRRAFLVLVMLALYPIFNFKGFKYNPDLLQLITLPLVVLAYLDAFDKRTLRSGVWLRPANLSRSLTIGAEYAEQVLTFAAHPDEAGAALVPRLWDLDGWAAEGDELLRRLEEVTEPSARLAHAAQLVRHLAVDPLLPAELLPADWPGPRLRAGYAGYQDELRRAAASHR